MTALSNLAAAASSETSLVGQEHEDVAFSGCRLLLSPPA
jgi:hypothetical protein